MRAFGDPIAQQLMLGRAQVRRPVRRHARSARWRVRGLLHDEARTRIAGDHHRVARLVAATQQVSVAAEAQAGELDATGTAAGWHVTPTAALAEGPIEQWLDLLFV